jgi:ParB family transcriptional regulator, chromosome partitioning protein
MLMVCASTRKAPLAFDPETLRIAARAVLTDVFSCRQDRTNSGIVARAAGAAIGADNFLPNMGAEEFLSCLSRPALEASCKDTPVLPRQRVKDTRAALVEHFKEARLVHPAALFAPSQQQLSEWLTSAAQEDDPAEDGADVDDHRLENGPGDQDPADDQFDEDAGTFRDAAE